MAAGDLTQNNAPQTGVATPGANTTDLVTALQGIIRQLTAGNANSLTLIAAIKAAFPSISNGTFTFGAAATVVVAAPQVTATSQILLIPTDASAATLVGSAKSPYVSARSVGATFTVSTASGGAAAGTETFNYLMVG